ncbi:MAG: DUF4236 domain-containing protein [Caldilineaceae bacterium]|nr:DUF4236 domain-containing protein [Caldilineaceae bacterium]
MTLNITNRSVGITIGNRGGRISINSRGRVTTSQSFPGTGLHRRQIISAGNCTKALPTHRVPTVRSKTGCFRHIITLAVGLVSILLGCTVLVSLGLHIDLQSTGSAAPSARPPAITEPTDNT